MVLVFKRSRISSSLLILWKLFTCFTSILVFLRFVFILMRIALRLVHFCVLIKELNEMLFLWLHILRRKLFLIVFIIWYELLKLCRKFIWSFVRISWSNIFFCLIFVRRTWRYRLLRSKVMFFLLILLVNSCGWLWFIIDLLVQCWIFVEKISLVWYFWGLFAWNFSVFLYQMIFCCILFYFGTFNSDGHGWILWIDIELIRLFGWVKKEWWRGKGRIIHV